MKPTCAEAFQALLKHKRRWEVRSAGAGPSRASAGTPGLARHRVGAPPPAGPPPPQDRRAGLSLLLRARRPAADQDPADQGAGLRWPVEEDFEFKEDCFGLYERQARLYTAVLRHAVLVMAALAICAVTTALLRDRTDTQAPPPVRPDLPPPAEPGMIPLTIPEIKRLLAALTTRPLPRWLVLHWDAWTRRHQARSRWFHKRARLARDAEIALLKA